MEKPKKVLVVDDDVHLMEMLSQLLPGEGIEIDKAFDGTAALGKLEKNKYDVILLDLRMPTMNGMEFLGEYKGNTPVVIMTSGDDELLEPFCKFPAFKAMLYKPRSLQPFLDAIAYAADDKVTEPKLINELDVPPVSNRRNQLANSAASPDEDSDSNRSDSNRR